METYGKCQKSLMRHKTCLYCSFNAHYYLLTTLECRSPPPQSSAFRTEACFIIETITQQVCEALNTLSVEAARTGRAGLDYCLTETDKL